MNNLLSNLLLVNKNFGFDKNTLKFLDTFKIEIADLFNLLNIQDGINFLISFDYKNKNIYEKFLNE